jgi:hypothetical protein
VCGTSDLEIGWGYVKQNRDGRDDRWTRRSRLGLSEGPVSKGDVMSEHSVRQAARRSALNAQAILRKERADRERRLEGLAVEVLTAIGERDGAVWDAERRAGEALRTMTGDEGLSVRAAAEWCGNGVTMREVTRLRRLAPDTPGDAD